ncbi:hypothetical protein [Thiomicrospira microaerophila]|uniref:hypothetical protein n=1 Tax=Thiomicrospira microaerophila TaxID=406020 RepID=UPI0005C7F785|nr:hypothetical protein [Thiomicrospira microaerophila]
MRIKNFDNPMFEDKLNELFRFLSVPEHRVYNQNLQREYLKQVLSYSNPSESAMSHLYLTVNTQSQPNLDELAKFFKSIHDNGKNTLTSYSEFNDFLKADKLNKNQLTYEDIYQNLKEKNGWGPKTSALYVKELILLHFPSPIGLFEGQAIWADAPKALPDRIYLPVDSVILSVFKKLSDETKLNWNFVNVNSFLIDKCKYSAEQMLVWDDLWFWGYFNQKIEKAERVHEWNPNKYWANLYADKSKIGEIEKLSAQYRRILES